MSITPPEKWSQKCAAAKRVHQLFDEGSLDPDNYDLKGLWESDELFQQYNINRFRTNVARIAKQHSIGASISNQCNSSLLIFNLISMHSPLYLHKLMN